MSHVIGEQYKVMCQDQCIGYTYQPLEVGRIITSVPYGRFKIIGVDYVSKMYDVELVEYL